MFGSDQVYSWFRSVKMKMVLVLVLFCVLAVSADYSHDDFSYNGCSDTDGEVMYALDDEVKWYADFEKGKGVMTQPDFVDSKIDYQDGFVTAQANQVICKANLVTAREFHKDQKPERDAPSSPIVYPKDEVELGERNSLTCYVTGFFPAPVKIYWKKNGQNVTEGVSNNVPLKNKDGTFSQFSRLEFTPQQGDIYSCSVSHMTLDQPRTRMYEVKVSGPGVGPAVFCGLGLTVGLLSVAAVTFFLIKGNKCS